MSGPIFVVELEPGLWMNSCFSKTDNFERAKPFSTELQALCILDCYNRFTIVPYAKIIRIDE